MSYFEDFHVLWEGKSAVVHAHIRADLSVQLAWIDVGNGPETHVNKEPKHAADECLAFSAWTPEKRAQLYTLIRSQYEHE